MPLINVLLALLLALAPLSTVAGDNGRGGKGKKDREGSGISADQAGAIARRQTGGRVLAVKPKDGGYRVKVLTPGGEVRQVFVPGR
ncbi:MAG: hypothetical protein WBM40_11315 [Thiohalocapsa sp.]